MQTERVPHVHRAERVVVDELGYEDDGIVHLTISYGFQDTHNVPAALLQASHDGLEARIDVANATYFVSIMTIVRGDGPEMARWRKKLFIALSRTSTSPVGVLGLPEGRTGAVG